MCALNFVITRNLIKTILFSKSKTVKKYIINLGRKETRKKSYRVTSLFSKLVGLIELDKYEIY